jgi:hypothetical protein
VPHLFLYAFTVSRSIKGNFVQYERRSFFSSEKGGPFLRSRRGAISIIVVLLAMTGAALGFTLGGSTHSTATPAQVRSIKNTFTVATQFLENVGVPMPTGVTDDDWFLKGDPIVAKSSSHPHVLYPEHNWTPKNDGIVPLSSSQAKAIEAVQLPFINQFFSASYLDLVKSQLKDALKGETGSAHSPSSPGYAEITTWKSVTANGTTGRVDAVVSFWEQQDSIVNGTSALRIEPGMQIGIVESVANLVYVHGLWKITSLINSPWQQAT